MQNIYKIFYVAFSNFHARKELPWLSTITMLILLLFCLFVGLLDLLGILSQTINLFAFTEGYGHLDKVPFFIFFSTLFWWMLSYLFVKKMKISKKDGTSPYYEYTPTKRDKILAPILVFIIVTYPVIIFGIKQLFGR